MSAWIEHVKNYARVHNVSYADALKLARPSYQKTGGGIMRDVRKARKAANKASHAFDKHGQLLQHVDADLYNQLNKANKTYKTVDGVVSGSGIMSNLKKARKTASKASNAFDKHGQLLQHVDADLYDKLNKANKTYKTVDGVVGGKFNALKAARKAKRISKSVSKAIDKTAPLVAFVAPEAAAAMETVNAGIKTANQLTGGNLRGRRNKYLGGSFSVPKSGGSFSVPKRGGSICPHCNTVVGSGLVSTNSSMITPHHPSFTPTNIQF